MVLLFRSRRFQRVEVALVIDHLVCVLTEFAPDGRFWHGTLFLLGALPCLEGEGKVFFGIRRRVTIVREALFEHVVHAAAISEIREYLRGGPDLTVWDGYPWPSARRYVSQVRTAVSSRQIGPTQDHLCPRQNGMGNCDSRRHHWNSFGYRK